MSSSYQIWYEKQSTLEVYSRVTKHLKWSILLKPNLWLRPVSPRPDPLSRSRLVSPCLVGTHAVRLLYHKGLENAKREGGGGGQLRRMTTGGVVMLGHQKDGLRSLVAYSTPLFRSKYPLGDQTLRPRFLGAKAPLWEYVYTTYTVTVVSEPLFGTREYRDYGTIMVLKLSLIDIMVQNLGAGILAQELYLYLEAVIMSEDYLFRKASMVEGSKDSSQQLTASGDQT
ncbi:hypothetical protein BDZ91DRAFT_761768 [Kalaharituber pfeilii]|nr:hypothetical protein BDZ91DRAFT_761768 [Kalaharituber pfeilii]